MITPRPLPFPLATLAALAFSACGGHPADPPEAETGYATGRVFDTRGEPIAGAKILLDNTVFYASHINGSTGQDGSYRLKVQPGTWKAYASISRQYNGRTYALELHPDTTDSFDHTGAVRNFTWKLEGRTPDNDWGYYGGLVKVFTDYGFHADLADIELTLTPTGPLIDGSRGSPLVLRQGDRYWTQPGYLEDIPIGRYAVSAVLKGEDGERRLRIREDGTEGGFQAELPIDFIPDPGGTPGATASIVLGD